ncbi:MAG: hypothetical protein ABSH12_00425 [Endomicrobiales bacterium]
MNKRRKYIIDRDFQYRYILRNLVFIMAGAVIVFVSVVVWNTYRFQQNFLMLTPKSEQLLEWSNNHHISPGSVEFACQFLVQSKKYTFVQLLGVPLLVTVVINVVMSLMTSLYFSHHMAGPLYRVKKALQEKIEGKEVHPINLRKHDLFVELAELTNKALAPQKEEPSQ